MKCFSSTALGAASAVLGVSLFLACSATAPAPDRASPPAEEAPPAASASFIVQGTDLQKVIDAVRSVGAEITHQLRIIQAVGARLTPAQREALESHAAVTRIYEDRKVEAH